MTTIMPFLSRRSVDPLTVVSSSSSPTQTPRSRARSEASLLRRVSTLFTPRRRSKKPSFLQNKNASSAGIGYVPYPWTTLPRVSSDSTPHSSLEIRRPSGLGRRASLLLDSGNSFTDTESFGRQLVDDGDTARIPTTFASTSLPNLLGGRMTYHSRDRSRPRYTASCFALSDPIFRVVLEFLPRHDLPAVARVSHGFCSAARYALYHVLDSHNMAESSREKLYNVLASREDLAALVISFYSHAWPGHLASTLVRLAFQNMYNLKSLTLPSFVSILSHTPSFSFSLTQLTILDRKMTQSQLVALRSWLATQPVLESLSFPYLAEYPSADPASIDECSPFTMTTLPRLTSLHASAEIVSALSFAVHMPIQHLKLDVHETLYTGLRPSAVIRALRGVRDMHIVFAPEVDKRTVEKFLGVTGSILTGDNKPDAMKSLQVEVSWMDKDAAERLYDIVTSIISRFRGLQSLKLTSPFRSIQPIAVPLTVPPLPSPPRTASTCDSSSSWTPVAVPPAALLHGRPIRKEFVACSVEQGYAKTWTKHCPSLSDIQFDFSCSTMEADVELCGVWFRRRMPLFQSA